MELPDQLSNAQSLSRVVHRVLALWPAHARSLDKGLRSLSGEEWISAEVTAGMVEQLAGDEFDRLVEGYRWMCAMVQGEELEFRRSKRYRYSAFADANREVYQNGEVMSLYMRGLLLSQVLWPNHVRMLHFYRTSFLAGSPVGYRHLEIGPGHGLLLSDAARDPRCSSVEAWDISLTSLEHTRRCMERLGIDRPITLKAHNILEGGPTGQFDSIVISEVLEHLEEPLRVLTYLKSILVQGGRIFVSVPINSPAIDHIYLLRSPEEATALVRDAGFEIVDDCLGPAGGYTEARARAQGTAISCGIIGRQPN